MTARPSSYLNWVPSGSPAYIQQPSIGQAATGYVENEAPPFEYQNWLEYMTDQWIQYLDGLVSGGAVVLTATTLILATTGDVTIASFNITNLASVAGIKPGQKIAGTGIPANAYVEALLSGTSLRMSSKGTSNQVGTAITVSHYVATGATIQAQLDQLDAVVSSTRRPAGIPITTGTTTLVNDADIPNGILYIASGAGVIIQLPDPEPAGFSFTVVDAGGVASTSPITVLAFAGENIRGVPGPFLIDSDWASMTFVSGGTNWWTR